MSAARKSGIQTSADGSSVIPSSKRADGSTRKEIKVRPGYRPPEDVETYKNRSAEAWKNRGSGGVPGIDAAPVAQPAENKSKNAKRREAAKNKTSTGLEEEPQLVDGMSKTSIVNQDKSKANHHDPGQQTAISASSEDADAERQKKIRNTLKKLKAIRDLKDKRSSGDKLSPDQVMKIGKEGEVLRDLKKLDYDGPEMHEAGTAGLPD